MSNIDTQGNYNNTPDSWDQEEEGGGAGDQVGDATAALSALNVNAAPFIPGQNPFAKEFVPSFLQNSSSAPGPPVPAENSQPPPSDSDEKMEVDQNGGGATNDAEENTPDDWAENSPENGSSADDAGGGDDDMEDDDDNPDEAVARPKPKPKPRLPSTSTVKKDHVNIVFIGHVDAGKSTIGGHIMYLTGMVDKRTLEKYEREAKEKNRESWYLSWALDTNTEERDKGKTVEVGRAYFETDNKHFTILDAPGHKSFVPNMIGGASQADVAVLVISARRGEFETGFERGGQTREHAMLVKTAGVKHLIVVVNKMDDPTVEWDEGRYTEIKEKLTPYLKKCGFNPKQDVFYIPVSGLTGAFLKETYSDVCSWYSGPPLIQYLDDLPSMNRMAEGPVRLPMVDRYKDMGTIVLGKVESGSFKKGASLIMMPNKDMGTIVLGKIESGTIGKASVLMLMPNKVQVEVMQLWSDDEETDLAKSGENVKVKLKNVEEEDVSPGFVLCSLDNLCQTGKVFDAQIVILEHKSIICAGYSAVIHIHTCAEEVTIKALLCQVDKKTGEKSKTRPRFVKQDQIAIVRFEIIGGMICLEPFKEFPQMGRFTLRDEGRTIAIGKVLKVIH